MVLPCHFVYFLYLVYSVKHEYEGKWSEETRLTTCDPHAQRIVTSSSSPQEVEEKQDVIFSYDVTFQVTSLLLINMYDPVNVCGEWRVESVFFIMVGVYCRRAR